MCLKIADVTLQVQMLQNLISPPRHQRGRPGFSAAEVLNAFIIDAAAVVSAIQMQGAVSVLCFIPILLSNALLGFHTTSRQDKPNHYYTSLYTYSMFKEGSKVIRHEPLRYAFVSRWWTAPARSGLQEDLCMKGVYRYIKCEICTQSIFEK
jgi:hypothetical protein